MTKHLPLYSLRLGTWDAEADAWAKLIPFDSPARTVDFVSAGVKSGEFKKLDACRDGGKIGVCVYQVIEYDKPEFLCVAFYGKDQSTDQTQTFLPILENYARGLGCVTLRFHTMRPGLVKKTSALGYRMTEIVMRKTL